MISLDKVGDKMFEQTVEKARGVVTNVMRHWSKPAKGNYVSYKEILNLGIGGMGVQFFTIVLCIFFVVLIKHFDGRDARNTADAYAVYRHTDEWPWHADRNRPKCNDG